MRKHCLLNVLLFLFVAWAASHRRRSTKYFKSMIQVTYGYLARAGQDADSPTLGQFNGKRLTKRSTHRLEAEYNAPNDQQDAKSARHCQQRPAGLPALDIRQFLVMERNGQLRYSGPAGQVRLSLVSTFSRFNEHNRAGG